MLTTTTIQEEVTEKIITAIDKGQCPPWRKPFRPDQENSGFPCNLSAYPFAGISVLLLNLAGFASRFWGTESGWKLLGGMIKGKGTRLPLGESWITFFNADQIYGGSATHFQSRKRATPTSVDYAPAEEVIKRSGAKIHFFLGSAAAYYYQQDQIIFPLKEQFAQGPGGLVAYYDSLFHELVHFSEARLGWTGPKIIRELRAEIAAPFLASQMGIPVLTDMQMLENHRIHLDQWIRAMKADPDLIFGVTADASRAVDYLKKGQV